MRRQLIIGFGLLLVGCGGKDPQKKPGPPAPATSPQKSDPTLPPATTPTPPTPAPASTGSFALASLQMSSEALGWGYRGQPLFVTQDGGAHWKALPMPSLSKDQAPGAVYLFDPLNVWFTVEPAGESASIWHTNDGGKTWETASVDLKGLDYESGGFGPFYFLDANRGWLGYSTSPGMNQHPSKLFSTTDGGKTWASISEEPLDKVSFVDEKNGFAVSIPSPAVPAQRVEKTNDGGKTWTEISLKPPKGTTLDDFLPFLAVNLPNTAHPKDGAIVVPIGASLFLYETKDGGATWTESPLGISNEVSRVSVGVAPTSVWVIQKNELSVTSDAGKTWSKSTFPIPAGAGLETLNDLVVIKEEVAFLTFIVRDAETALFKTSDGGKTWTGVTMSMQ